jgi:hypothetical protein
MRREVSRRRARRWTAVWLTGAFALLLAGSPTSAQGPAGPITKVEEDWELVVSEPDPDNNAPQVFIVNTPTGHLDGTYSVFEINNLSLPDYYGGGLQLQTWWGEVNTANKHHSSLMTMATTGETVTFTTSMKVYDNTLRFKVKNGTSTTWGTFGGDSLTHYRWTNLTDLGAYSPEHSAANSRVGFSGNRVAKLELKRVRYYSGNDLVSTQELNRVVHDGSALAAQ